jgi:hypothetical protein
MAEVFTQSQLQAVADALGDTSEGLSGSEIEHLLATCKMGDPSPAMTKRHRLHNAFVDSQNNRQDRVAILAFIRKSMKPELYAREPQRYEPMRTNLNRCICRASGGSNRRGSGCSVCRSFATALRSVTKYEMQTLPVQVRMCDVGTAQTVDMVRLP